jgi:hypothetical protein
MTVRILADIIVSNRAGAFVFPAEDDAGRLQIWVTPTHWDQLWVDTPQPATDEECLAFAIASIERAAAEAEASTASDGSRVLFVG